MSQLVEVLGQRVVSAFAGPIHWPRVVGYTCACLAGIGATALPIGLISGYLKFKPITQPTIIIKVASVALILPGLVEEFFYRVILLPNPLNEKWSYGLWSAWIILDLVLFTCMHLLNPRKELHDVRFLAMAGLLGGACVVAYLGTGTIYSPWAVHWLAVLVWLLVLGGFEKVRQKQSPQEEYMQ